MCRRKPQTTVIAGYPFTCIRGALEPSQRRSFWTRKNIGIILRIIFSSWSVSGKELLSFSVDIVWIVGLFMISEPFTVSSNGLPRSRWWDSGRLVRLCSSVHLLTARCRPWPVSTIIMPYIIVSFWPRSFQMSWFRTQRLFFWHRTVHRIVVLYIKLQCFGKTANI